MSKNQGENCSEIQTLNKLLTIKLTIELMPTLVSVLQSKLRTLKTPLTIYKTPFTLALSMFLQK